MSFHVAHEAIPASRIKRTQISKTLSDFFSHDVGDPPAFDSRLLDRSESLSEYRIPEHQRWPQWSKEKQIKLVDSVFKNYPISGIETSQHIDHTTGNIYYNIEDGQTRLSILHKYYNNEFEYCGKLFRDLQSNQQRRFERYTITVEIIVSMPGTTLDEEIHEMFERLQEGTPLRHCDKFWNRKDTDIVKFAIQLIDSELWRDEYMSTTGFSSKKRKRLADVVGLIASLICEDGTAYITRSFQRLYPIINVPVTEDDKDIVYDFIGFYFELCDKVYERLPLRELPTTNGGIRTECMKSYWNLGQELGMIIYDYLNQDTGETDFVKQERWIGVINIARTVPNFMGFKSSFKTLWNGLSAVDMQNTLKENIAARVRRVRDFSNLDTRGVLCENFMIEWQNQEDASGSAVMQALDPID